MTASVPPGRSALSRRSAAQLLGCAPDAPPDDVRAAFRRSVLALHPDRGGEAGIDVAALTAARDLLLGADPAVASDRPRSFTRRRPLWQATRRLLRRRRTRRSVPSTTRRVL